MGQTTIVALLIRGDILMLDAVPLVREKHTKAIGRALDTLLGMNESACALVDCARAERDPAYHGLLAREAAKLTDWGEVVDQAAAHGLGSLLYIYLRAARVQPPPAVPREPQGLYTRHMAYSPCPLKAPCFSGGMKADTMYSLLAKSVDNATIPTL